MAGTERGVARGHVPTAQPAWPPAGEPPAPSVLPDQRAPFVGRQVELAQSATYLAQSRLFTLLGAAGCGKSRLAIRLAGESLDGFADGCFYVDLSSLGSGEHVLGAPWRTAWGSKSPIEEPPWRMRCAASRPTSTAL